LDMDSREILEDALERFEGTLITVSHDRYFINRIADVLWIVKDGRVEVFTGSYDDYINSQKQNLQAEAVTVNKTQLAKERAKERLGKEEEKKKRARIREIEKSMENKEAQKKELEELFSGAEIYTDNKKLLEAQTKYEAVKQELDSLLEEWMELN